MGKNRPIIQPDPVLLENAPKVEPVIFDFMCHLHSIVSEIYEYGDAYEGRMLKRDGRLQRIELSISEAIDELALAASYYIIEEACCHGGE